MSNKYVGLGFSLKVNSTVLAGIRGMSRTEASGTAVDVTVLDDLSTSDRFMRKKGGLVDPGALTMELAYDPGDGSQCALRALLASGVESSFTVIYPTTTISETFQGIVNGVGQEIPFGELVSSSVRIDVTGNPGFKTST